MPDECLAYQSKPKLILSDISFKAISDKNMAFLCDLYRSTRWEEVMQTPWDDQQRIDFLNQQFETQHAHYQSHYPNAKKLLIIKAKQSIGRIYIDRDDTSICLIDVALIKNQQGLGLGTLLLKELINEAQLTNKKIVIHVERFNPAYNWYLKHGFVLVEDKGVYQYMEWYPEKSTL